jgi:hypothetical protein
MDSISLPLLNDSVKALISSIDSRGKEKRRSTAAVPLLDESPSAIQLQVRLHNNLRTIPSNLLIWNRFN